MTKTQPPNTATYLAYAKVNLILRVVRKRPDGYHDIESLMQTVDLADTVTLRWGGGGINVTCSDPDLAGEANLAWKAASVFNEAHGHGEGVDISITKAIPVAAGLGGGSTDAACVLAALAERRGLGPEKARLSELALRVGSDVPYLLAGGPAVVRGRGEIVEPLEGWETLNLVIATPPVRIRSSWAYGRLRMELTGEPERSRILSLDTAAVGVEGIAAALHNDLERAVFRSYPDVRSLKERMTEMGALGVVMSGSGPSVLAVERDKVRAEEMAAGLRAEGSTAFAVRTTGSGRSALE